VAGEDKVTRIALPVDLFDHLDEVGSAPIVIGHFFYPAVRLARGAAIATVIREPVERAISVWEYLNWQTMHPDHATLAESGIATINHLAFTNHLSNLQTRLLGVEYDLEGIVAAVEAGEIDREDARVLAWEAESAPADEQMLERAKERLRGMQAVGVTEELPAFVGRIERYLGLREGSVIAPDNVTPAETVARRGQKYDAETRRNLLDANRLDAKLHAFAKQLAEQG
jgi:hypothetical protein